MGLQEPGTDLSVMTASWISALAMRCENLAMQGCPNAMFIVARTAFCDLPCDLAINIGLCDHQTSGDGRWFGNERTCLLQAIEVVM